jgi:hypothetical protein
MEWKIRIATKSNQTDNKEQERKNAEARAPNEKNGFEALQHWKL